MSEPRLNLGILVDPGLWVALIPFGVIFLGIITFEVAMAVTISTLPRSRMQQRWTPREQQRVLRVFLTVFSAWPMIGGLILAHLYLPLWAALIGDALVLAAFVMSARWLGRCLHERRLIMAGHCVGCLYDLRGSIERAQCPECGVGLRDHPAIRRSQHRTTPRPELKP